MILRMMPSSSLELLPGSGADCEVGEGEDLVAEVLLAEVAVLVSFLSLDDVVADFSLASLDLVVDDGCSAGFVALPAAAVVVAARAGAADFVASLVFGLVTITTTNLFSSMLYSFKGVSSLKILPGSDWAAGEKRTD